MNKNVSRGLFARALAGAWLAVFACANATPATAAELRSLKWAGGALELHVDGAAKHETQSLEDGKRLRLKLFETKLAAGIGDIDGRGRVKGVYPYLAENGGAVYVDLLLSEAGSLSVEPASFGFRLAIGSAAASAPESEGQQRLQDGADTASGNAIEDIIYTKLPGDRLQIKLKMSEAPDMPVAFTISNPPRVSLDFRNTKVKLPKRTVRIGEGAVASVVAVEAENRTRVVLNLVKPVAYETHLERDGVTLIVESPVSAIAGTQKPKTTQFASAVRGGKHRLNNIDFRRGAGSDGKVIIELSNPGIGINIYEQAGEIMVDFLDTSVPQDMQRRLDVVDFATPIQTIDTFVQGRNTRMVIKPKGKYEHLAYQAGNMFTVNVKPVIVQPGEEKKPDEFGYTGEKLSLNFQNIDVRAALQVIADFTNLNFVTSDTVKGSLTLRLKDVPWDQALDIITKAKGLAVRRKGNVVMVAPSDEVAAREKADLEATKQVLELEPLVSELIQINYAKAGDIAKLLKSVKAVTGSVPNVPKDSVVTVSKVETESNSLLSPRGQVTVDERTNSILVQDTAGKIREIRKLIAKLDQPVRQVMIEARLVEATDTFSKNLGIRFGTTNNVVTSGVSIDQTATLAGSNLNVNLPAAGAAGNLALTIAKLGTSSLLNLELSALEEQGKGKIISSPRLITASQKKARIEQGQEQIIPTFDGTETKKAVLSLDVTPQITPDDRIILDVEITKDNFVEAESLRMNTKRMNTQVLLDNGETVVIGGVYEQNELNSVNQVPFFGDLPLLGWLFKNKGVRDDKTELLIFLTPRILAPALSLN